MFVDISCTNLYRSQKESIENMPKIAFTVTRAVDLPLNRFSQNSRLLGSIKWTSALQNFTQISLRNAEIMFRNFIVPVSKERQSLLGFHENLVCWTTF
jgi:hypothetical protein